MSVIRRLKSLSTIYLCHAAVAVAVPSADLLSVFHTAVSVDPTYQAAIAQYQVTRQALPERIAAVLPRLDLTAAINREWDDTSRTDSAALTTHNYGLDASQMLFDWGVFSQIGQSRYRVRAASYTLAAAQQALMQRTAKAYFNVLSANAIVDYTRQQVTILKRQLSDTQIRFKHKEATITELEQAKGAYYDILNDLEGAKLAAYDARQALMTITATQYTHLAGLKSSFPLISPQPAVLATWEARGRQQNLSLLAAESTLQAAHQAVSAQVGGFLPTITADGSYVQAKEPTTSGNQILTQRARDASIGVAASWNLFQGGLTVAQIKAAHGEEAQAQAALREQYLTTLDNVRTSFETIQRDRVAIMQARRAIHWNTSALAHAEEGYRAGIQTLTDILQIQNRLFASERNYVQDVNSYLNAILALKAAVGTLSVHDLSIENRWLKQS